jgi:hypothetical protein
MSGRYNQQGMAALKHANSDQSLYLMPEFQNRLSVLRSLQYIDAEETVLLKVHPPTNHSLTYLPLFLQNALVHTLLRIEHTRMSTQRKILLYTRTALTQAHTEYYACV